MSHRVQLGVERRLVLEELERVVPVIEGILEKAPEAILSQPVSSPCDWWALGVLLYEMVMGGAPHIFDRQTNKPHYDLPPNVLYKKILDRNFEFYFPECASF